MKRALLGFVALSLGGCSDSKAEVLEGHYREFLMDDAAASEKCEAATKIADAYADEGNKRAYSEWKLTADTECLAASSIR